MKWVVIGYSWLSMLSIKDTVDHLDLYRHFHCVNLSVCHLSFAILCSLFFSVCTTSQSLSHSLSFSYSFTTVGGPRTSSNSSSSSSSRSGSKKMRSLLVITLVCNNDTSFFSFFFFFNKKYYIQSAGFEFLKIYLVSWPISNPIGHCTGKSDASKQTRKRAASAVANKFLKNQLFD